MLARHAVHVVASSCNCSRSTRADLGSARASRYPCRELRSVQCMVNRTNARMGCSIGKIPRRWANPAPVQDVRQWRPAGGPARAQARASMPQQPDRHHGSAAAPVDSTTVRYSSTNTIVISAATMKMITAQVSQGTATCAPAAPCFGAQLARACAVASRHQIDQHGDHAGDVHQRVQHILGRRKSTKLIRAMHTATAQEAMTECTGMPLPARAQHGGASRRASEYSMREAVMRRHQAAADGRTTKFIRNCAPGTPSSSSVRRSPTGPAADHSTAPARRSGRSSRCRTGRPAERVARLICCAGLGDSDAAMVTISTPRKANITPSSATTTACRRWA